MKRPARKAIPRKVKDQVLIRQQHRCADCGKRFDFNTDKIQYDHRPAIVMRAVNVEGTDYHPPQNDPDHIDALHKGCHLRRTVGRLPGAEKTVTTKGSDTWLAAKFRKLEGKNNTKSRTPIPSRGFPEMKRPFPKRIK